MPRIFLHPGEIKSKNDGQIHYISAPRLANLYRVDYRKCRIIDSTRPETYLGIISLPEDIHLYPRYDGNYSHTVKP